MTDLDGLKKLREPFPADWIGKLPKPYKKDSPKGNCRECGGYHGLPALHLDYVGHADLTARLLDADPEWAWEPFATDETGLPALDRNGGLWIRLTVCGMTRIGYGDAQGKSGGDAVKEAIGDALRNAAMRFGAALDLWRKGDREEAAPPPPENAEEMEKLAAACKAKGITGEQADAKFREQFNKPLKVAPSDEVAAFTALIEQDAIKV